MKVTATMRAVDDSHAMVRAEAVYDTDLDDLWLACTAPARLSRWIADVTGELQVGRTVDACFTSTWTGPVRIEICEAPHHLLLTMEPGTDDETQLEAWLTEEEAGARLVVEERGLPRSGLHFYGAGWQVHLEDLARSLTSNGSVHPEGWSPQVAAPAWNDRWSALVPGYRDAAQD